MVGFGGGGGVERAASSTGEVIHERPHLVVQVPGLKAEHGAHMEVQVQGVKVEFVTSAKPFFICKFWFG